MRVSAVSYLNTSPLVWGMLHGPQRGVFDLRFELPAGCAHSLESGEVDIGLVPVIEMHRQGLEFVPGLGIASEGPVRSILLISKVPASKIRTLSMDDSSRTSVVLARIILQERFGVRPVSTTHRPSVDAMLVGSDAALIIGDPALHYEPSTSPYHVYDLGEEWLALTGLPMVYAVWAGRAAVNPEKAQPVFEASYQFGRQHIGDIVRTEAAERGFPPQLATDYLTRHIVYELHERHNRGLARFLELSHSLTG